MWAGPSTSLWWMVPLIQLVIWLLFVLVMILGMNDGRSSRVGERERRAAKTLTASRRRRRIVT
jgi:hypothetical protein